MSKAKNLTLNDLPLFATDEQIGEAVLGWERRKEFRGLATLCERYGMPTLNVFWGGRYVPAVRRYLDVEYGLASERELPLSANGREGNFHSGTRRSSALHGNERPLGPNDDEASRARYGYTDKIGNARKNASGTGKVKVTAPDGRSWIEDANEGDPRLWHRKLPYKPKRKLDR